MDEMLEYLEKLRRDLLEQFRGKPNTNVFHRAMARQFAELYEFFLVLGTLHDLKNVEGVQLDGIGDIVCLTRTDALVISRLSGLNVPMDDETYRIYLAFKIHLNTSNCTHRDVYRALTMFWDRSPLFYSEDTNHPATMFFSTPTLTPEDDASKLLLAPKVKAAGVALKITATTENPLMSAYVFVAFGNPINHSSTRLPDILPPWGLADLLYSRSWASTFTRTRLPESEESKGEVEPGYIMDVSSQEVQPGYIRELRGTTGPLYLQSR